MPVCRINNGDQKCWNLFSDISKSSDPSPSTRTKLNFEQMGGNECFFLATALLGGGVGGRRDEPKADQKIDTAPSSFVLH